MTLGYSSLFRMMSLLCIYRSKHTFFLCEFENAQNNVFHLVPAGCVVLFLLSSCKVFSIDEWFQLDWYGTFSSWNSGFWICVALSISGKEKRWRNLINLFIQIYVQFDIIRTTLINAQCQSIPIKIMALIQNSYRCQSMPICKVSVKH